MLTLFDMEGLADTRRGQGRMYDLPHVVLCCILAVAAGADLVPEQALLHLCR